MRLQDGVIVRHGPMPIATSPQGPSPIQGMPRCSPTSCGPMLTTCARSRATASSHTCAVVARKRPWWARLDPQELIAELERENGLLREELWRQWLFDHEEHCGLDWPHPEERGCHWPPPELLPGGGS
jgi:hypothetical protein